MSFAVYQTGIDLVSGYSTVPSLSDLPAQKRIDVIIENKISYRF
jgi:hypothetical protein